MMKKLKGVILSLLIVIFGFISIIIVGDGATNQNVQAKTEAEITLDIQKSIKEELENFIELNTLASNKQRFSRVPGSKAEYNSAIYIKNKLSALTNFKAVNNQSTKDGVENFEFTSIYDGLTYTSQNVIFKRESLIETDRKVILGAHYDTTYIFDEKSDYSTKIGVVGDGINDNASSVALLLALIEELDKEPLDYGYDIEVVFFGASTNNYDGSSFYVRGQSDEDAKNTLLMINFDKIGLGEYNYAYVNEFETSQETYLFNRLYGFKKLKNANVLDFNSKSPNGLNYSHVGLESDHANFMARNINVLSLFSGNYESPLTFGLNEYKNKGNVTFTKNDSYSYILTHYKTSFYNNLTNIYKGVSLLLKEDNFISEMEKTNNLENKYDFWTNEKLAVFISSIMLVVFVVVYLIIYWNLQQKSRKMADGTDIKQIVIKITDNLGMDNKDQELKNAIDNKIKNDTEGEESNEDEEDKGEN